MPDKIVELIVASWHSRGMRWGFPLLGFFGTLVAAFLATSHIGPNEIVGATVIAVIAAGCWQLAHRVPRASKGRVGLVVAIAGETEQHDNQVRSDLIGSLRTLLQQDVGQTKFDIVVYPRYLAQQCHDYFSCAQLLSKSRALFMVYGSVRNRLIDGKASHYIELDGLVRHALASERTKKQIATDFSRSLPRRRHFPVDNDIFSFELTSETVDVAARFVIGLAALVSNDLPYAETMLKSAEQKVLTARLLTDQHKVIAKMLPERFEALYQNWLRHLSAGLDSGAPAQQLEQAEDIADKLLARTPTNYSGCQVKAICCFERRRDTKAARKYLLRCRAVPDPTWLYSAAFLDAYDGNIDEARKQYKRAFRMQLLDPSVPLQCELFMQRIVALEPNRVQLHFCMGLINEYVKSDAERAIFEYEAFLDSPLALSFPIEVAAARASVARLRANKGVA